MYERRIAAEMELLKLTVNIEYPGTVRLFNVHLHSQDSSA